MSGILLAVTGAGGLYAPASLNLSADYNIPFDIGNYLISTGWNGIDPVRFSMTIPNGIVLSSNTTNSPAFSTTIAFPIGSDITVYNYGYIVGMGGRGGNGGSGDNAIHQSGFTGGDAVYAGTTSGALVKFYNYGVIAAGGGGGGGAYSNFYGSIGAGGGGGRSGRTNTPLPAYGYGGAYVGTFSGPGPGIAPTGSGNSGPGGGWGSGGGVGSAWPGDWTATYGGSPGRAIVTAAGFLWPNGYGTYYGAIS